MRFLVLQFKRIGDLVLTTPALAALRARYPDAAILLALDRACEGLAPLLPGGCRPLSFERGRLNIGFWRAILAGGFDACLDFTGGDRAALVAACSRARRRITYRRTADKPFRAACHNEFVDSSPRDHHTIDHHLNLLAPLDVPPPASPPDPILLLPDETRARVRRFLPAGASAYAVVQPGSARGEKCWLPERWAEVVRHLADRHSIPTLLVGAPQPDERAACAEIARLAGPPATDLCGQTDLPALAALVAGARVVLGVDSACVHLAAAFRRPQVALFGPTNPFHWRPRHPNAISLLAAVDGELPTFATRHDKRPLSALSTLAVIRGTDSLIERTQGQIG